MEELELEKEKGTIKKKQLLELEKLKIGKELQDKILKILRKNIGDKIYKNLIPYVNAEYLRTGTTDNYVKSYNKLVKTNDKDISLLWMVQILGIFLKVEKEHY